MRLPPLSKDLRSMMPRDLKELLRPLNDHAVNYLIVGGYAFGVHAEPRATKGLHIFIRTDDENSKAVFRALAQYGAPLGSLTPSDFMDGTTFQIGQPPARIDILQRIDGVSFDETWVNRVEGLIDGESELPSYLERISFGISLPLDENRARWMPKRCVVEAEFIPSRTADPAAAESSA